MGTAILVQPLSVSPAVEMKKTAGHSEFWAPLCFALFPLVALAIAALLLGHGTISAASLNNAVSFITNGIDCLQSVTCP
jgi:hypothetical protein